MDLYEALKAGTTKEELEKAFQKDLDTAFEKLAQEKAEEAATKAKAEADEAYLADCREELAVSIIDYIDALLGVPEDETEEDIDKEFEAIIKALKTFEKTWKDPFAFLSKEFTTDAAEKTDKDLEIINDFVKTLLKN